jgi:hypothetical protein
MTHYLALSLFGLPLLVVVLCARIMGIGTRARGQKGAAAQRIARRSAYGGGISSGTSSGKNVKGLGASREVIPGSAPRPKATTNGSSTLDSLKSQIATEQKLTKATAEAHRTLYAEKDSLARARQAEDEAQRYRDEEAMREKLAEAERERQEMERRLDEERSNAELRNAPGRSW